MKSPHKGALVGITAVALASTMGAGSAQATGTAPPIADGASKAQRHDNLPNPLAEAQARVQKEAVDRLLSGTAKLETRGGERVIALSASADWPFADIASLTLISRWTDLSIDEAFR